MRVVPERRVLPPRPEARVFGVSSPEFSTAGILSGATSFVSTNWFSANDPIAIPFVLPYGAVVSKFFWRNGTAAGGNWDVGIYDRNFVRKLSTGSTAGVTNNVTQIVDVADTALPPGRYYLVVALDNVTGGRCAMAGTASSPLLQIAGVLESATNAFPLPDPLTNMALPTVATRVPAVGFSTVGFPW